MAGKCLSDCYWIGMSSYEYYLKRKSTENWYSRTHLKTSEGSLLTLVVPFYLSFNNVMALAIKDGGSTVPLFHAYSVDVV